MWANKVGQSEAGAPKLASLPPTNEAFIENVARAHTGSKQPVWKLFNMVTMTTINLLNVFTIGIEFMLVNVVCL